jgi:hypothetical protein
MPQCSDLYMAEGRHEVCGDLCHFLFRYSVGRILFTGLENLFEVPPSFAAPLYRKNSTDMVGTASNRVIRIVARWRMELGV